MAVINERRKIRELERSDFGHKMEEKKREQNVVNGKILEGNQEGIRNIKEDAGKKIKFSKEKEKKIREKL